MVKGGTNVDALKKWSMSLGDLDPCVWMRVWFPFLPVGRGGPIGRQCELFLIYMYIVFFGKPMEICRKMLEMDENIPQLAVTGLVCWD